jgi:hypothetical protein
MSTPLYTKEELIEKLKQIRGMGWIPNARHGNVGGIGNTLEDLLGIHENNLPIPNSAEWELKTHRMGSGSLNTLFHSEPSPRALKFVPKILLPKYGWPHKSAGIDYPPDEKSFRQTLNALSRTDRGFKIIVDREQSKVRVSFDANAVSNGHREWLDSVEERVGNLAELDPQPYWGFSDLYHKAGTKLLNCFYVNASVKKDGGIEYYHYQEISILQGFNFDKFIKGFESGILLVDFDARTGHNHGTKIRIREDRLSELYESVQQI